MADSIPKDQLALPGLEPADGDAAIEKCLELVDEQLKQAEERARRFEEETRGDRLILALAARRLGMPYSVFLRPGVYHDECRRYLLCGDRGRLVRFKPLIGTLHACG